MIRLPIPGFRRREDRWATTMVMFIILTGFTAIAASGYLKFQAEWDESVAIELRDFDRRVSEAFADLRACEASVDRAIPIDLRQAMTPSGAKLIVSLPGATTKIGDDTRGPLLSGYLEIHGVRLANAVLAGKVVAGPDIYIGELWMDVRRRYMGEGALESRSLGRVMVMSEKNIFNTFTVKGCRLHATETHRAELCELTGGSYDRTGRRCLESCPERTVTLPAGLVYQLPRSVSGSLKHLVVSGGDVQMSAQCYRGAWMMFNERVRDGGEFPRLKAVGEIGRLTASKD